MIKQISVAANMIFKTSPKLATFKVALAFVSSVSIPFSLYALEKLTDAISNFGQEAFSVFDITIWGTILIIITLWNCIQDYLATIIQLKLTQKLKKTLLLPLAEKIGRVQYEQFENSASKNIFFRLKDNPHEITLSIFDTTLNFLNNVISIIGIAFLFVRISFWFFGLFLLILLPVFWCDYNSTILIKRMHKEQTFAEREMQYYDNMLSNKNSLQELKVMNAVKHIQALLKKKESFVLKEHITITAKSQLIMLFSTLLLFFFSAVVMLMLMLGITNRLISLATFVSLTNSIQSIYSISYNLSESITILSRTVHEIEYFEEMYNMTESTNGTQLLSDGTYEIAFEKVSFSYPYSNKQVLKNLTFKIKSGEKICIVGRNGAGKSTIVKLLCGLYRPDSGNIKINGINIEDICVESLKSFRSIVFQEYYKYYSTIRENVAYSNLNNLNNDLLIYNALNRAQASDFVNSFKRKLETPLGNIETDSVDLSEGQWQKLAIARACLPNSSFIFMDEPTSSLDPIAENMMYLVLSKALDSIGYLLVSHRLASTIMAERIIVIEKGQIIEDGTHEELMHKRGLYYTMFKEQSSWYTDTNKGDIIYNG